jgi:antitoxin HicB
MNILGYDIDVRPLADQLGGGFVAHAPALKGCLADGETRDEALQNLEDAIRCWLEAAREKGMRIPRPKRTLVH